MLIVVDKSLAKAAWSRLLRQVSANIIFFQNKRNDYLKTITPNLSGNLKKHIVPDVITGLENIIKEDNSLLFSERHKFTKTSSAESIVGFSLCQGNQLIAIREEDNEDPNFIYDETMLGVYRRKFYVDKNRIDIWDSIWFCHFSSHFVYRWFMRNQTIDTNYLNRIIAKNFFFIEFIRFAGLVDNTSIAIPFGKGLALGFIRHREPPKQKYFSYSCKKQMTSIDLSHNAINTANIDPDVSVYIDFRTYISYKEMRRDQHELFNQLHIFRSNIDKHLRIPYHIIQHMPHEDFSTITSKILKIIHSFNNELNEARIEFRKLTKTNLWLDSLGDPIDGKMDRIYQNYLDNKTKKLKEEIDQLIDESRNTVNIQ